MLFMMCALIGFSQGTDDFNTLDNNTGYGERLTLGGWRCVNTAVNAGTSSTTLPQTIGNCGRKHVVINGKTTAVGSITSPTITGGCGTLSFSFANVFNEQNGAAFTVKLVNPDDATDVLYDSTVVVSSADMTPTWTNQEFMAEVNVAADFVLITGDTEN